jgi:hypothetical protein
LRQARKGRREKEICKACLKQEQLKPTERRVEMLGSQIEKKRAEMHTLIEQKASDEEILKVSQELDVLIVNHYKATLKQGGGLLNGKKGAAQNTGIIHEG